MIHELDAMRLKFDPGMMIYLKMGLGLIMLGVALDIDIEDLKSILKKPKSIIVGVVGQFVFLPLLTFILIWIFKPIPSVALGLILVAACPGGNFSNLFTLLAKGNTALSVGLTFIATVLALFMTPFNITFWGKLYPPTAKLVEQVSLNPTEVAQTVFIVLGIPLIIGMWLKVKKPNIAARVQGFIKKFSIIFIVALIGGAFATNFDLFAKYIHYIIIIVAVQNFIALGTGFVSSTLLKLPEKNRRAITLEIGIQNSGLGLALAFEFFHDLGGVALVCAWWGIWHALSGTLVAFLFQRKDNRLKA